MSSILSSLKKVWKKKTPKPVSQTMPKPNTKGVSESMGMYYKSCPVSDVLNYGLFCGQCL